MKLWTDPQSFTAGNFNAWIVRVARNRAVDALRSRSARTHDELPEALPAEAALEDTALADIDARAVREALAELPEDQRTLIDLGFFGGATHYEIARRTGIPLGTVKTRIRSGLRRLRSSLDRAVNV
jgi:RNA polymerase sigma-70 factor (ECF subfamily)